MSFSALVSKGSYLISHICRKARYCSIEMLGSQLRQFPLRFQLPKGKAFLWLVHMHIGFQGQTLIKKKGTTANMTAPHYFRTFSPIPSTSHLHDYTQSGVPATPAALNTPFLIQFNMHHLPSFEILP